MGKTVTIISQEIAEKAQAIVNGNTCMVSYNYVQGTNPNEVRFELFRGLQGDEDFTGLQEIGGSMQAGSTFSSYNIGARQAGDGALVDEIYLVCDAILKGTAVKETPTPNAASSGK